MVPKHQVFTSIFDSYVDHIIFQCLHPCILFLAPCWIDTTSSAGTIFIRYIATFY